MLCIQKDTNKKKNVAVIATLTGKIRVVSSFIFSVITAAELADTIHCVYKGTICGIVKIVFAVVLLFWHS